MDRSARIRTVTVQPEGSKGVRIDQTHRLKGFQFTDSDKKADVLSLSIENNDLANFDDPIWRKGGYVTITWGNPGNTQTQRLKIVKVMGSRVLSVQARAKSAFMNTEKKARVWTNTSKSTIALDIAKEYGYSSSEAMHIEDTEIMYDTVHQSGMTDAQLLAKMAKQEGFQFYVDMTGFHFHQRNLGQKPIKVLHYYSDPGRGNVIDFDVENDITAKAGAVVLKGRNPMTREDYQVKGNNEETKREGLAPNPETQGDEYETKYVPSGEYSSDFIPVTSRKVVEVSNTVAPTEAEAKRIADGKFRKTQLGTVKLSMEVVGDAELVAKSVVEVRGLGERLSGNYYVSEVTHDDSDKYECSLKLLRDGHSERGTPESKAAVNKKKGKADATSKDAKSVTDDTESRLVPVTQTSGDLKWVETSGAASGGPNDIDH